MAMTAGLPLRWKVRSPADRSATSSSLTILTTCWPADRLSRTSWPMARSRTRAMKSLTTLKLTSASRSARRTSRIAASTSASLIRPRPVRLPRVLRRRSLRVSNMVRVGLHQVVSRPDRRVHGPGGARVLTHRGRRSVPQGVPSRQLRVAPACLVRNPFASPLWQNQAFVRVWGAATISIFGSLVTADRAAARGDPRPGRRGHRGRDPAQPRPRARRSCSGWSPAPGSTGCAAGRSSSGRTSAGRRCSARSRSPSRSGCLTFWQLLIVSGAGGGPDDVLRRGRQRLPADDRRARAAGRRQLGAGRERLRGRVHGLRDQRLPRPAPDRADRHRGRCRHVPRLGAPPSDDPAPRRHRRPGARTGSRSSPRSAMACGWCATTRSCGRSPAPRWRSPRCGGSSARRGFLFVLDDLGIGPAVLGVVAGVGGFASFIGAVVATRATRRWGIGPVAIAAMLLSALGNAFIPLAPAGLPAPRDRLSRDRSSSSPTRP